MGKSIFARIMLSAGVLILAILLCQIVFGFFFSQSAFIDYKKRTSESLFYELKANYSDDLDGIFTITRKAEEENIDVMVFDDHTFIYSSRNPSIPLIRNAFVRISPSILPLFVERPKAVPLSAEGMGGGPPVGNGEMLSLTGRFEYKGQNRYVMMMTPIESIDTSVRLLTRVNVIISCFALIAGLACAYVFSRMFSRHVRDMRAVAQHVASMRFDLRANEDIGVTELNELSASINTMAERLKAMFADLKHKNERLRLDIDQQLRLDKMRREFVANVSHELKTPLCLLQLYSENLKSGLDSIDRDFYCDTIIDEVKKLDEMAKSLLDVASIENGLSSMKLSRLDLSGFCGKLLSETEVVFREIRLDVSVEDGLYVDGDAHYIEQAMKNYIMNAVSHTAAGGRVSIALRGEGGDALFSVFNEGRPISDGDAERVWESFYKTDRARAREEESHAGLGLYIVKTVINAHGGEFGLENRDGGVCFWFSLPLAGASSAVLPAPQPAASAN